LCPLSHLTIVAQDRVGRGSVAIPQGMRGLTQNSGDPKTWESCSAAGSTVGVAEIWSSNTEDV
jgi:hypothetical protein